MYFVSSCLVFHLCVLQLTHTSIVNIGSIVGNNGFSELAGYASTKTALIGLTKCFAVEMAKNNIRANCDRITVETYSGLPVNSVDDFDDKTDFSPFYSYVVNCDNIQWGGDGNGTPDIRGMNMSDYMLLREISLNKNCS